MKKLAILLSAVLLGSFASCKKAYSCECITTIYASGSTAAPDKYSSKTTTYSEKMAEKQAKSACEHEAVTIKSNLDDVINQAGATGLITAATSCELK